MNLEFVFQISAEEVVEINTAVTHRELLNSITILHGPSFLPPHASHLLPPHFKWCPEMHNWWDLGYKWTFWITSKNKHPIELQNQYSLKYCFAGKKSLGDSRVEQNHKTKPSLTLMITWFIT